MKADEIVAALRRKYVPTVQAREWAFFSELRVGTGYAMHKHRKGSALSVEQRIDAWAMSLWPSKKFVRIAYEIKVSKSDFKREIEDPEKRQAALLLSNMFYFATPAGLVQKEDIPQECGLVEVWEDGKIDVVVRSPFRVIDPPPLSFLASIARRATAAEGLLKEAEGLLKIESLKEAST